MRIFLASIMNFVLFNLISFNAEMGPVPHKSDANLRPGLQTRPSTAII